MNCYFILMDTTKERDDIRQMEFFKAPVLNDLNGYVQHLAARNKVPTDAIRLFVCPDKKTWDKMSRDFQSRVDWNKARAILAM